MTARFNRIGEWFWSAWATKPRVDATAYEFARLGELRHVLADIALRGRVWRAEEPRDALALAYEQGRRSLALEILELAEMDPRLLRALVDAPIVKQEK